MKYRLLGCLSFCLLGIFNPIEGYSQVTPAWTRQLTPAHWQELSRGVILPRAKGKIAFMDLSRKAAVAQHVKTTDQNWLHHKVFFSGVFSRQEKDILLAPSGAQTTLGKVVYLHNKHAAFYNQLTNRYAHEHIKPKAFERHQQILRELTGTLQHFYLEQQPTLFASAVFSKEEIQRLQTFPSQPNAYVLSPKELEDFAGLPTLQAQQHWTDRQLKTALWETESLLLKPTGEVSPAEFEKYYIAHARLSYLKLLARVLERASDKRASAIVRYRLSLREGSAPLTDAQRGGKLLFEKGNTTDPSVQEFTQNYEVYAAAEALNAPYEIALQYGSNAPELLGAQEGKRLRQLDPSACLEELQPKIENLEKELEQLRLQTPSSADFYKQFYRVHATLQIYKTLAARAQVMLHF